MNFHFFPGLQQKVDTYLPIFSILKSTEERAFKQDHFSSYAPEIPQGLFIWTCQLLETLFYHLTHSSVIISSSSLGDWQLHQLSGFPSQFYRFYDITAIILSGGKSFRMGRNKSLLKIGDKTIIERIRDQMKHIFKDVIWIANTPNEYKFLDLPIYEDTYKHTWPLAVIHSGLINSSTDTNFIISCDLLLITKGMIKYLVEFKKNKLITVARAHRYIQ